MHKWQGRHGPADLTISIVRQPEVGPTFDDEVKRVRPIWPCPPSFWRIELTDQSHSAISLIASFDALRAIGVRFAADDFGTGYSCLQHQCCPIYVKIDQSFVAGSRMMP
ncbi:EAL domain-containing protein (plasmid) [Salmonella enterica subsp. enterica]|nr:EAL domain-containing protein [Salmonella enterica subsp. enterica]